jgi:hypothetical protein
MRPLPNLIFDTVLLAIGVSGVARALVWAITTISPGSIPS